MLDMMQPLLSCESWDWHGAVTACVLMKWAGLLSIIGMDGGMGHTWEAEGFDCLHFLLVAKTLEGHPKDTLRM